MKIKRELAEVFDQACKDVGTWEVWQRSLDPQGGQSTKDPRDTAVTTDADESGDAELKRSA